MFKSLVKTVKNHLSLLVIIFGAVCFLFTNIMLKEILGEYDYGRYSIIITFLSIIYIFGLFGFEQVFIRFSNSFEKNIISTQKYQLGFLAVIILTSSVLSYLFYLNYFQEKAYLNKIVLFLSVLCMISTLILFNIFRLNGDYSFSQFLSNGWKILLFAVVVIFSIFRVSDFELLVNLLLFIVIGVWLFGMFNLFRKIRFDFNQDLTFKETFIAFFLFFISISSFSIVMFADRFIIESKLGTIIFGDYFYLTNFVLAPFSILQNYIGFKQVVNFKNNFSIKGFTDFSKKIFWFSVGLSFLIIIMIVILNEYNFLNFNFANYMFVTGLLLLLGIIRLYSSSIISAFEAKTTLPTLKKANLITIIFTILISLFVILFVNSLDGIIIGFIFIWIFRSLIYRKLLLIQAKEEYKV